MKKIKLIGEVGQGHEGDFYNSFQHIKLAKKSNADAIKFQIVYSDDLATIDDKNYKLFKRIEMNISDWKKLFIYSKKIKLDFYAEIFGPISFNVIQLVGIKKIKLHPTDLNNYKFLKTINKSNVKEIILGVGGALKSEILKAINLFKNKKLILMHGFQGYPTFLKDNQLKRLFYLKKIKQDNSIDIGFADHTPPNNHYSFDIIAMAISMGAQYIEKHFTVDRRLKLEDCETAMNPNEFKKLSAKIKVYEDMIGESNNSNDFGMNKKELIYRKNSRRDVVASRDLKKGTIIRKSDIGLKRTSKKNSIKNIKEVIGKKIKKTILMNNIIQKKNIK